MRAIQDRIAQTATALRGWDWATVEPNVEAIEKQVAAFPAFVAMRAIYERHTAHAPFSIEVTNVVSAMTVRTLTPENVAALGSIESLRSRLEDSMPDGPAADALVPVPADLPSVGRTGMKIQGVAALIWLGLVVAGVFLGVQLLWAPNKVWGDVPDVIAALLWGAGVWAASGQPFGGTDALLKTIKGTTA